MTVAWAGFPITDNKATQIVANPAQNVILGLIEPPAWIIFYQTYFLTL
jgi:hypothetical protein